MSRKSTGAPGMCSDWKEEYVQGQSCPVVVASENH